jgi:hypothetical protein
MSKTYRTAIGGRMKPFASAVALTIGFMLIGSGSASAVQCVNGPGIVWLATANDPPAEDDRAIRKLIHLYDWLLDDHRAAQMQGLFMPTIFYELCNAAGEQLTQKNGETQLQQYLTVYFNDFTTRGTQPRHIASNTLLHWVDADTVRGKTTVVVTLQHPDIETPVVDYTGVLRTEFEKTGDVWRFLRMTLIMDSPKLDLRAR